MPNRMPGYDEAEFKDVSSFLDIVYHLIPNERSLYRGQPVDRPLLPLIARNEYRGDLAATEAKFLSEFRRRAHAFHDVADKSDWQLLALAQHVGAPTRLLDWSQHPLAALWFAVAEHRDGSLEQAVVWKLNYKDEDLVSPDELARSPFELNDTKIYQPDHINPRIAAQASYFSVHKYWEKDSKYLPLEKQGKFENRLRKLLVRKGMEKKLFVELGLLGYNYASLFPDLSGLARHLSVQHNFAVNRLLFSQLIGTSKEVKLSFKELK